MDRLMNPLEKDPALRRYLREKLRAWGVSPNKRLGQSFLVEAAVADRIVEALSLSLEESVIEIGPGAGVLTVRLARQAGYVAAVEIDRALAEGLRRDMHALRHVAVLHADAIDIPWNRMVRPGVPSARLKVTGNLPYAATGPLLERFLIEPPKAVKMVIMVQKEVADRLTEAPGSRRYGALSVMAGYRAAVYRIMNVKRTCFWPEPKVDSSVLGFDFYSVPPVHVTTERHFFQILRSSFQTRRKMLKNALTNSPALHYTKTQIQEALREADINGRLRPEALDLSAFAKLSNALESMNPIETK